jgi:hypothetical protein
MLLTVAIHIARISRLGFWDWIWIKENSKIEGAINIHLIVKQDYIILINNAILIL